MKRITLLAVMLAVVIVTGCSKNTGLVRTCGTNLRSDVFCELKDPSPVPQGYADLSVESSLKTHKPGYHQAVDRHGTSELKLLINVDGQAAIISGKIRKENIEARRLSDPEAGDGTRYFFRTNLRLKAGAHKIVVAMPENEFAEERQLVLTGRSSNRLVLEPVYGTKRTSSRRSLGAERDFLEGIEGFRVLLNGKSL